MTSFEHAFHVIKAKVDEIKQQYKIIEDLDRKIRIKKHLLRVTLKEAGMEMINEN